MMTSTRMALEAIRDHQATFGARRGATRQQRPRSCRIAVVGLKCGERERVNGLFKTDAGAPLPPPFSDRDFRRSVALMQPESNRKTNRPAVFCVQPGRRRQAPLHLLWTQPYDHHGELLRDSPLNIHVIHLPVARWLVSHRALPSH